MKSITCGVLIIASACVSLGYAQPSWAEPAAPAPSQTSSSDERTSLSALIRETRSNPKNVEAWLALGQRYLDNGVLEKAKESFLEAVTLDYLSAEAHFGLGLTEYARGDFAAALFEFGEVARLFPTRFDGHYNRAVTLAKLRRTEEAVSAFQEAIAQAEPEASAAARVDAYLGLAEQLKTLERFGEAAEAYTAASDVTQNSQQARRVDLQTRRRALPRRSGLRRAAQLRRSGGRLPRRHARRRHLRASRTERLRLAFTQPCDSQRGVRR